MKLAFILCIGFVYLGYVNAGLLGGWGDEETATSEIQGYANRLRKTIESSAGVIIFPRFKVITYKKQMVAGTKYILKIEIDTGRYIHVKIFRSLKGKVTFAKVKTGKSRTDPLVDFE